MEGSVAQALDKTALGSSLVAAPSGDGELPWLAAVRWLYFNSEEALQSSPVLLHRELEECKSNPMVLQPNLF